MSCLISSFLTHADNTPEKTAIICENKSLTYDELRILVNKIAHFLYSQNIKQGEKIGLILPNNIEFCAIMLATAKIGAAIVPLSLSLPNDITLKLLKQSNVKHLFSTKSRLSSLSESKETMPNGVKICIDSDLEGCLNLTSEIKNITCKEIPNHLINDNTPYIYTMTSGSTGTPKPIVLSQKNKYDRAISAINLYKISSKDSTLAATPLYHSLAQRLVLIPLLTGGTCVILSRFSAEKWKENVINNSVSFTIAVSSQLKQISKLISHDDAKKIQSLRCIVSSSALLEKDTKENILTKFNCDFHECYGTSEIAIATNLSLADAEHRINSVGKAVPTADVKILKPNKEFAAPFEKGEIICKTPMLFEGYENMPKETLGSMHNEYFKTGDLGYLDEDGFLFFSGRKKDIIITGGINVFPKDIENVVNQLDEIEESAAFPLQDDTLGEIVALAIVTKKTHSIDPRKIKIHCLNKLADFQQPRKIFTMEALPKSEMGKVMKHQLVQIHSNNLHESNTK